MIIILFYYNKLGKSSPLPEHHPAVADSQIFEIASLRKALRTDYRHFVITDIEVIEVTSRKQGVIEQLLTRGSASITGVEGYKSEGVRRDQQFMLLTTFKEGHKGKTTPLDWCPTLQLSCEPGTPDITVAIWTLKHM